MMEELTFFAPRVITALFSGIIIGLEREFAEKAAGLKTITIVTLGGCIFTALSFWLYGDDPEVDPTRIIGQVVTGVGFLGAGAIFRESGLVVGLTTASLIWVSCALGCVAGAGLYTTTVALSIFFVTVLYLLRKTEQFMKKKNERNF
jgi:putative Mg2+ transporter-C (MgtC) family protein